MNSYENVSPDPIGKKMHTLIERLYPICRSITGKGVRRTLEIIQERIPLHVHDVPTGTKVFDWTVPKEWNIRDAYIKDPLGRKIVDFHESNLHVLNYSVPVNTHLSLSELKPHLYSMPDRPEWIPYRTSYYNENWGFCISHNQLVSLEEGTYEVVIDSTLSAGSLTYGEFYKKGAIEDEVLLSTHVCHPSMCNDNLSGVALAVFIAEYLAAKPTRYSYRILFIPGTIGAITWLNRNQCRVKRIKHGLVLSGVGDKGELSYKKSRRGDADVDIAAVHALKHSGERFNVFDFEPYGYDERQFCSPGFNLPVGRLSRSHYGKYPEYHTSADNLDFVRSDTLAGAYQVVLEILHIIEKNRSFMNQNPYCEPQLGKRGLYRSAGEEQIAMLWVLNLSDGHHDLLEIAERAGMAFRKIREAACALKEADLLTDRMYRQ